MAIIKSRIPYVPPTILVILGAFVFVVWAYVATAGTYAESAHGDPVSGVDRSTATCENWPGGICTTGDCAHCHDTFDPAICGVNERMMFYSTQLVCDMICFECHGDTVASAQEVTNYPYSVIFGGWSTVYFPSILHQFCATQATHAGGGSRHSLAQIWSVIKDNGGGLGFPANPNPCGACHNPHSSQAIGNTQFSPPYDSSKSPLTRPSERYNNPTNLWGDGATERMDEYASSVGGIYQAPYYGSFDSGQYEPAGDGTPDGSNLPDYVTLCMDCHQYIQWDPERSENVRSIQWGPPWSLAEEADRHGAFPSNDCANPLGAEMSLRPPYVDSPNSNYVLSCTDCHEPHGTYQRLHLIRRFINGEAVGGESETGRLGICDRCHAIDSTHRSWSACDGCHLTFHGSSNPAGCGGDPLF
jgi:hypothetical protein